MNTTPSLALSFFAGLILLLAPASTDLLAQELEGIGSIAFSLEGPDEDPRVTGKWTLVRPGNQRTTGTETEFSFDEIEAGMYTFTTELPEGTSAIIDLLLDGKRIKTVEVPQINIPLDGQENYIVKLKYSYSKTGTVAVNSTPSGLSFTLKGPNETEIREKTPFSHIGPQGQWTAYFDDIEGCPSVPAKSDKLLVNSRITFAVNIVCDNVVIPETEGDALEFVSVPVDGNSVLLRDVRTEDWFAPYVYTVAKAGVLSGYNDENGNPKGMFGPSDNVTIAQLAKVAHEMTGIDETKVRVPVINARARGQWFEFYFASAEQRNWEVWRDERVSPSRSATRAEVLATVLRAFDVRRVWANGKMFDDVSATTKFASSIETAAVDGLIDAGGSFRPNDPINRAELAKIVSKAIELYIEDTSEMQG